jgi:hypothetical protein
MVRTLYLLLILCIGLGCTKVSSPGDTITNNTKEELHPSHLIVTVLRVLEASHRSGSLVFRGSCTDSGGVTDSFKIISPVPEGTPIEALRKALMKDSRLKVKEDSSGMIRVADVDVQPEILGMKISNLKFKEESDPREAVSKILSSQELATYMRNHRIEFIATSGGLIPPPSGRHLSGTMTDVTVSQSLDRITETFPGVWTYEECLTPQGEKRVVISFHEFSAPPPSKHQTE